MLFYHMLKIKSLFFVAVVCDQGSNFVRLFRQLENLIGNESTHNTI